MSIDASGLQGWTEGQATKHFYLGEGSSVTLQDVGFYNTVTKQINPHRLVWKQQIALDAKQYAKTMPCGTTGSFKRHRSVGVHSGVFWIGGFSLFQEAECYVSSTCGTDTGFTCGDGSFKFKCFLKHQMNDLFEDPSDFDNSKGTPNEDIWDDWEYGGTPFYVTGRWDDVISGSGSLR